MNTRAWSDIERGRHAGRSIAQVALRDPDYLFWGRENGVFAEWNVPRWEEVVTKASRIRLPPREGVDQVADYTVVPFLDSFLSVRIRRLSDPPPTGACVETRAWLDLGAARGRSRNKTGARKLLAALRVAVFAPRGWENLTRARCESFLDDDDAFVLADHERERFDRVRWFNGIMKLRQART